MEPNLDLGFESTRYLTQAEFAAWVERQPRDGRRYELLNGRVVMNPPAGWPHGSVEARLVRLLGTFVDSHRLGEVFGSSQGFELPSGDTVEPDASFVSKAALVASRPEPGAFLQVVPELVAEILSASSTATRDRGEKKGIYERNGVREYWLIDPNAREVTIFALDGGRFDTGTIYGPGAGARSRLLAGLEIAVDELFAAIQR